MLWLGLSPIWRCDVQEIDYWQTQSGLAAGLPLSSYKHHYLKTQAGFTDTIDSLWYYLWGEGGELAYWRSVSGLPSASLADAKAGFLRNPVNSQSQILRLEVSTV